MIGELATMFQKMATMVNAQEEMIKRIDQDVDDSSYNVPPGPSDSHATTVRTELLAYQSRGA